MIKWTTVLVFAGFFFSCTVDYSNEKFLKEDTVLTLVIKDSVYNEISRTEILPNSTKYIQLKNWLIKNTDGWTKSPASYIAKVSITSKNYGLLIVNSGVVLTYKDKDGKPIQLSKSVDEKQFNFLFE